MRSSNECRAELRQASSEHGSEPKTGHAAPAWHRPQWRTGFVGSGWQDGSCLGAAGQHPKIY